MLWSSYNLQQSSSSTISLESSAKQFGCGYTKLGKSSKYRMNNKGPNIDPCGTPILTGIIHCLLLCKKLLSIHQYVHKHKIMFKFIVQTIERYRIKRFRNTQINNVSLNAMVPWFGPII